MVQGPPPPAPRRPHRSSPRRRQAPCCCPSARQSPVGSKQGMPTGRRAPAWLEAFLTQWPGRLSICEGPAAAFTARRPGLQPHSRAHPGLSRVVSLRHPEPALPRPPPQLGPRRSTEAAATTSQVHSPGGDSTSRELASGTGQLNAFIAFTCTEPPKLYLFPKWLQTSTQRLPRWWGNYQKGTPGAEEPAGAEQRGEGHPGTEDPVRPGPRPPGSQSPDASQLPPLPAPVCMRDPCTATRTARRGSLRVARKTEARTGLGQLGAQTNPLPSRSPQAPGG